MSTLIARLRDEIADWFAHQVGGQIVCGPNCHALRHHIQLAVGRGTPGATMLRSARV